VRFSPNRFDSLTATLRFVQERYEARGTGRNRTISLVAEEYYSESRTIPANPALREIETEFTAPDDPEWVTQLTANPAVRYWELVIEANVPGIDFRATFPLPVYARR